MITDILPKEGVEFFNKVKDEAIKRGNSDADSTSIAWELTKSKLVKQDGRLVAMSNSFKPVVLYSFDLTDAQPKVIMNSDSEEIVLEAVLASVEPNTEGKFFTEEELVDIDGQIKLLGSTLPDVDHEKLRGLVEKYGRDDAKIIEALRNEKGVFKSIKSLVKDGKLWIQAFLDKRYKNHIDKFTGLSIEALADAEPNGRLRNPRYLGFTFTNNPKIKSAKILK